MLVPERKSLHAHKNLYIIIYNSFICNPHSKLGLIPILFNMRLDKQAVEHPDELKGTWQKEGIAINSCNNADGYKKNSDLKANVV